MKKIYLLLLLFTVCLHTQAQKVSYIFTAGFNEFKAGSSGMYPHDHFVSGYNFGSLFDIRWGNISLQPGWLIKTKGGTSKDVHYTYPDPALTGYVSGVNTERIRLDYIEVPVNIIFWIKAPKGEFFVGGGPYGAVGLGTHQNMDNQSENIYFHLHHVYFDRNGGLKRFDYGLNSILGYKLENGIGLNVGYSYALTNFATSYYPEYTRNRGFNISVSYTTGGHKK